MKICCVLCYMLGWILASLRGSHRKFNILAHCTLAKGSKDLCIFFPSFIFLCNISILINVQEGPAQVAACYRLNDTFFPIGLLKLVFIFILSSFYD